MFAGDAGLASREAEAHHLRGTLLARLRFFPDFFRGTSSEKPPPLLRPSNGCFVSRFDELAKAAMMIKYENESVNDVKGRWARAL